jgi:dUTP pyrophosphatase
MLDLYVRGSIIEVLPGGKAPKRATPFSVGFDVFAREDVTLYPFVPTKVPLGFRFTPGLIAKAIPWDDRIFGTCDDVFHINELVCEIRPRSSMALRGVEVVNAPGTIDPDFPGEFCAILRYIIPGNPVTQDLDSWVYVGAGDKVAQLVFPGSPLSPRLGCEEPDEGATRTGGFGSTGAR